MSIDARPPAIALMGPTASGKSALALEWAQRLGGEIVSVDSALVYRGLDIGSAKPDKAERAAVPHHLVDVREPWQAYSAADFAEDARAATAGIVARGRRAPAVKDAPARILGISMDNTRAKRAAAEAQLQQEQLAHLSRVATMSAFSGSLAHELSQPLGSMLTNAQAGELCTCKADAAMSLVDTEFMAVIIASMKGKDVPADLYDTYNDYIARSTEACGMGSAM